MIGCTIAEVPGRAPVSGDFEILCTLLGTIKKAS